MKIEWNRSKAKANPRRYGIDFAAASTVLVDDLAVTIGDPFSDERVLCQYRTRRFLAPVLIVVYASTLCG